MERNLLLELQAKEMQELRRNQTPPKQMYAKGDVVEVWWYTEWLEATVRHVEMNNTGALNYATITVTWSTDEISVFEPSRVRWPINRGLQERDPTIVLDDNMSIPDYTQDNDLTNTDTSPWQNCTTTPSEPNQSWNQQLGNVQQNDAGEDNMWI